MLNMHARTHARTQASQGQMYTSLATGRIAALSEEIEALQKQKAEAIALVHNLEQVQVRAAIWVLQNRRAATWGK